MVIMPITMINPEIANKFVSYVRTEMLNGNYIPISLSLLFMLLAIILFVLFANKCCKDDEPDESDGKK